jgi:3-methyl-2-oxobutanoate hydroxymethyltransferase
LFVDGTILFSYHLFKRSYHISVFERKVNSMAKKKMTILDFKKYKEEGRKFAYVTAYDYTTASIVDESDVEVILVGDSLGMIMLGYKTTVGVTLDDMIHHIRPVVKGAPNTFVAGDMPFGSYQESPEQAIRSACRMLMETNCDCVKLEGGEKMAPTIRRMVDVGIPVMGHIGMTPQSATNFGGFKVQGGTPEGARQLIKDAKALEDAGVFSIVVECVPSCVAKVLTASVSVPILGIGAGPYVDCQVLVTQDLLDMYGDFKPKFVKQFAHIRKEMVAGLNAFHQETLDGVFPTEEFSFNKKVEIPPLD